MPDILKRLKTEVLIGAGASLRTSAERKGLNLTENVDWWAINHPDEYQGIVKASFDAGCDFIFSGGANRLHLKKFGLQDKTREINYKIVKLTKEVTPKNCYLFCSLPTLAMFLQPMGDASPDEVYESYVEQIAIAQDVGVDVIRINASSNEIIELGIKAIKEHSELPIAAQVSLSPTPKGFRTMTGLDPTTAAKKFEALGVDIVGTICGGLSYKETTAALREMKAACNRYLFAMPNAGVPELVDGKVVHPGSPEEMAKEAPNWVEAGARLITGCCGTTLEHIAKVVSVLK